MNNARLGVGNLGLSELLAALHQCGLLCARETVYIPGFIVDTEVLAKVGHKAGSWGRAADRLEVEIVCLCSLELQRHSSEGVASRHESMVLTP